MELIKLKHLIFSVFGALVFLLSPLEVPASSKQKSQKENSRLSYQQMILEDWAMSLNLLKKPEDFIKKYQSRYTPEDLAFLKKLISEKSWVEMPVATVEDQTLVLTLPSKVVRLEVIDYFKSEYQINGYRIDWHLHPSHPAQIRYLQRIVQKKSSALNLWEILWRIQTAEASITCNALIQSGCVEISAATALWVAQEVSADTPIKHCLDIYYYNKNNSTTMTCLNKYKNSPNLEAMKDLAEIFVQDPHAKLELSCSGKNGPDISINGVLLLKINNEKKPDSYLIPTEINPNFIFNKVPELALKCCKKSNDELAGTCENFVNSHLGQPQKRTEKLNQEHYRIQGKPIPNPKKSPGSR